MREIGDTPGCDACTIRSSERLTFDTGERLPGIPLQVVRDARGRYVLLLSGHVPLVFSENGEFLQALGRTGEGPGEFRSAPGAAALPGDSLIVVDGQLSRASVFGPDLSFVRTIALPVRVTSLAVLNWPTRVVANGVAFTAEHVGWPVHSLDFSSSQAHQRSSFGDNRGELRPDQGASLIRRFFGVHPSSFWTLHVIRYQLTRYSNDGEVLLSVRRQAEWFSGASPWSTGGPETAPPPALQAAAIRGDTLWVAARIPRPDWNDAWRGLALPPVGSRGEVGPGGAPDVTQLYMSRIEAIDLRSGSLIARSDIDGIVVHLDHTLAAVVYDLDRSLQPRLRRFELRLTREGS